MKDAYYFPHDSNAKDDPKCIMMIEQLGLEGYGIYWVLVETLRDQVNYKYPIALLPALSRRFNTTFEKMKAVVNCYDLFETDENNFFSISLINRMEILEQKRIKRSIAGKKGNEIRWNDQKQIANESQCDNNEITKQSQSIASKVKESKENKIKEKKNTIGDFFEIAWSKYPRKKGKESVSQKQKEKLYKIGLEEIGRAIDRFIKDNEGKKEEFLPYGSTFFNSGYVDYLDNNYQDEPVNTYKRKNDIANYQYYVEGDEIL